ncbi:Uncharacterised protein [Vibrio cholerae]|nr:Uncharacterised protein [Vibrio cholerae]
MHLDQTPPLQRHSEYGSMTFQRSTQCFCLAGFSARCLRIWRVLARQTDPAGSGSLLG